jgi:hypothetical protein
VVITKLKNSKLLFFRFLDVLKEYMKEGCTKFCYCDTDSFLIAMTEETLDQCVKDDMKEKWAELKPKWFAGSSMASQKEPGLLKEEAGISRGWFLALSPKCYIICEKEPCDLEKKIVAKENEYKTLEILSEIKEEPQNTIKKKSAKGCNRKIPLR